MSVPVALATGTRLLARAKRRGLPSEVARARTRLAQAHRALQAAAVARGTAPAASLVDKRAADRTLDAAWGALHGHLAAWTRVQSARFEDRVAQAKELVALLFPDGLRFLQLPFDAEWAESSVRIARMDDGARATLRGLGAQPFVESVEEAHAAYGRVLGMTATTVTEVRAEAGPTLNERLAEFRTELRAFVLAVASHDEHRGKQGGELLGGLLEPVMALPVYGGPRGGDNGGEGREHPGPASDDASAPASGA